MICVKEMLWCWETLDDGLADDLQCYISILLELDYDNSLHSSCLCPFSALEYISRDIMVQWMDVTGYCHRELCFSASTNPEF